MKTDHLFYAILGVNCVILALGVTALLKLPLPLVAPIGLVLMLAVLAVVEIVGHFQDRHRKF